MSEMKLQEKIFAEVQKGKPLTKNDLANRLNEDPDTCGLIADYLWKERRIKRDVTLGKIAPIYEKWGMRSS